MNIQVVTEYLHQLLYKERYKFTFISSMKQFVFYLSLFYVKEFDKNHIILFRDLNKNHKISFHALNYISVYC